ncbi:carbohydrate ABC transporter permease [Candidatus Bathyarchaeota archaeon]|nr:carbohydrate ABC transporter permease [Candidatus Bathyarchaeota archaeon]
MRRLKLLSTIAILSIFLVYSILPVFMLIISSFKTEAEIRAIPYQWFPSKLTLFNYEFAFRTLPGGVPIENFVFCSLFYSTVSTAVLIFYGSLAGFIFAKFRSKLGNAIMLLTVFIMFIPFESYALNMDLILRSYGLHNTLLGLVIIWFLNPFWVFFIRQACMGIPSDLIEAAKIDGASTLRIYWEIVFPLLRPLLAVIALFFFVWKWDDLLWPLLVIDSPRFWPLTLLLYSWKTDYVGWYYHQALPVAVIIVIPTIIVFFIFLKYFVRGAVLTAGLKGWRF